MDTSAGLTALLPQLQETKSSAMSSSPVFTAACRQGKEYVQLLATVPEERASLIFLLLCLLAEAVGRAGLTTLN